MTQFLLSESKFNLTIRLYIAGSAPWSRTGGSIHKLQPCSSKDWPGTQSSNNGRHPNQSFLSSGQNNSKLFRIITNDSQ